MKLITESNILQETSNTTPMIIEFQSSLCPPCIMMEEVMYNLESKINNTRMMFGQVDIDTEPRLEQMFKIDATPTFIVVQDGKIIGRHEGKMGEKELRNFICESIVGDQARQG